MIKSAGVPMVSDLVPPRRFPVFNALLCLLLLLGIAKGTEAAGVRPPETATVTYNGANSKITLTAPSGLSGTEDIAFLYKTGGQVLTAKGGRDCRSAEVVDKEGNGPVVVTIKNVRAGDQSRSRSSSVLVPRARPSRSSGRPRITLVMSVTRIQRTLLHLTSLRRIAPRWHIVGQR